MAGPVWIEDNSIGQALSGLADSFSGKTGAYMANVQSEIWMREQQRRKLQQQMEAEDAFIQAERARQGNFQPPTPGQTGWATSAGPVGQEVVPPGGPAPLKPYDPQAIKKQDTEAAKTFGLEREKQLATAALGARHASSMSDVAKATPEMAGQAQVALYGVPKTVEDFAKVQTQLTGQLPVTDTKTASGYAVLDANNQVIASGVTNNFRTDANGQPIVVPPGGSLRKQGELPGEVGPLKDEGSRLAAIDAAVQKVARGQTIDQREALTVAQAMARQFPDVVKLEKDDVGNVRPVVVPEHPMAKVYGPLVEQINRTMGGGQTPAPAADAFDRGAPPIAAPNVPGVTPRPPETAAIGGTAGVPTAPAQPAAAGPIIPTGVTATAGPPVIAGSGQELQKELFNSQFYKQYSDAMIAYNNVRDALKSDNQSADLRAIYALAKLYDPGSVVREGELRLTQGASSAAERVAGLYNALSGTGARLTPSQRADIIQQAYGAAQQQYESMNVKNREFGDRARRLNIDPRNVQVELQVPAPPPRPEEISGVKRPAASQGAQPLLRGAAPAATGGQPLPKVGDVVNGRKYLGGDPRKRESWE